VGAKQRPGVAMPVYLMLRRACNAGYAAGTDAGSNEPLAEARMAKARMADGPARRRAYRHRPSQVRWGEPVQEQFDFDRLRRGSFVLARLQSGR
jgi:hypothetical protein